MPLTVPEEFFQRHHYDQDQAFLQEFTNNESAREDQWKMVFGKGDILHTSDKEPCRMMEQLLGKMEQGWDAAIRNFGQERGLYIMYMGITDCTSCTVIYSHVLCTGCVKCHTAQMVKHVSIHELE